MQEKAQKTHFSECDIIKITEKYYVNITKNFTPLRGNILFPRWVIVSLGRFHKAKRLKECFLTVGLGCRSNKYWLLNNKGSLLKKSAIY